MVAPALVDTEAETTEEVTMADTQAVVRLE